MLTRSNKSFGGFPTHQNITSLHPAPTRPRPQPLAQNGYGSWAWPRGYPDTVNLPQVLEAKPALKEAQGLPSAAPLVTPGPPGLPLLHSGSPRHLGIASCWLKARTARQCFPTHTYCGPTMCWLPSITFFISFMSLKEMAGTWVVQSVRGQDSWFQLTS